MSEIVIFVPWVNGVAVFMYYTAFVLYWVGFVIIFILLVFLVILWWLQSHLLYFPDNALDREASCGRRTSSVFNNVGYRFPSEYSIPYESVFFLTEDLVSVHGWLIVHQNSIEHPTLLFFHGNAGNIGHRMHQICALQSLDFPVNLFLVDYRGYGNSGGTPSEKGITEDAEAALRYLKLREDINSKTIFAFGRSLGGGVAMKLAHRVSSQLCGVIVENTFTSIDDMVIVLAKRMGIVSLSKFLLVPLYVYLVNHWNNKYYASNLSIPVLYISGLKDELIPPAQMQRLYDLSTQSPDRRLVKFSQGEHNNTFEIGAKEYDKTLVEFLKSHIYSKVDQ